MCVRTVSWGQKTLPLAPAPVGGGLPLNVLMSPCNPRRPEGSLGGAMVALAGLSDKAKKMYKGHPTQ